MFEEKKMRESRERKKEKKKKSASCSSNVDTLSVENFRLLFTTFSSDVVSKKDKERLVNNEQNKRFSFRICIQEACV